MPPKFWAAYRTRIIREKADKALEDFLTRLGLNAKGLRQ